VYKCTPSHLDDHRDCITRAVSRFWRPIAFVVAHLPNPSSFFTLPPVFSGRVIMHLPPGRRPGGHSRAQPIRRCLVVPPCMCMLRVWGDCSSHKSCPPLILNIFFSVSGTLAHWHSGAIASLHDMISKLQRVVCHLNDRISTVEQMSGIAPPAIVPVTTGMMLLLLLFLRLPPLRLCHSPSFFHQFHIKKTRLMRKMTGVPKVEQKAAERGSNASDDYMV
jgi:hypothetical protein